MALISIGCRAETFDKVPIKINNHELTVELADTHAKRAQGLMNRHSAEPGMLLMYNIPRLMALWMHDTLIPLDVAFIAEDGKIVSIIHMKPLDETSRESPGRVIAALEMTKGWYAEHQVKVGDKVTFTFRNQ